MLVVEASSIARCRSVLRFLCIKSKSKRGDRIKWNKKRCFVLMFCIISAYDRYHRQTWCIAYLTVMDHIRQCGGIFWWDGGTQSLCYACLSASAYVRYYCNSGKLVPRFACSSPICSSMRYIFVFSLWNEWPKQSSIMFWDFSVSLLTTAADKERFGCTLGVVPRVVLCRPMTRMVRGTLLFILLIHVCII